jgi:hypothetical protein
LEGAAVRVAIGGSRRIVAIALLVGVALFAGRVTSGSARTESGKQRLTVYAVATAAQFMDHSDDRARGDGNNPFDADTKALAPVSAAREKGKGPYPGDDALYSFKLYAGADLKQRIGSATYTCVYNFDQKALCEAYFTLNGSALFASGPVDFTSTQFTLAVTGGTSKYLGTRGEVASAPAAKPSAKNETRLDFVFG